MQARNSAAGAPWPLPTHLRRLWCRKADAKRPMLLLAKRQLMTTAVATNSPPPSQLLALACPGSAGHRPSSVRTGLPTGGMVWERGHLLLEPGHGMLAASCLDRGTRSADAMCTYLTAACETPTPHLVPRSRRGHVYGCINKVVKVYEHEPDGRSLHP